MPRLVAAFLTILFLVSFGDSSFVDPQSGFSPSTAFADDDDDDDDDGDDDSNDDGGGGNSHSSSPSSSSSKRSSGGSAESAPFLAPIRRLFGPQKDNRGSASRRPAQPPAPQVQFASGEIIVLNLTTQDLQLLLRDGFRILEERTVPGSQRRFYRLAVPDTLSLPEARDAVRALPSGQNTDFNHYYRPGFGETGCQKENCAALKMVNWPNMSTDAPAVCSAPSPIGMIDTGINRHHEVFANAKLKVISMLDEDLPASKQIHGTAIAALLVGQPGTRVRGLLPSAELIAIDAFHRDGRDERTDAFTLVDALYNLAAEEVSVVNLSLAGPPNSVVATAITDLVQSRGIAIVAAAGNNGPNAEPAFPAAYPEVLAVTAIDKSGKVYRRAIRGGHIDLAAPGVNVWTAASIKGARWKTGTSFAVPFVTAAVSLVRARHPELTPDEVYTLLKSRAEDLGEIGPDAVYGAGLLSAEGLC
ncbi:MAG: S8 family serine peptidase [Roseibium sp.]|uniref:S8 family serine peptidase n=1 Tax=Roseibium sp. TaxID=1936156 RepID=UPI002623DC91|nr:S8 family serine peptidase [Roseibium sp.]MCV0425939.1 S8 family serine peptidase [Roseibium sp.]